MLRIDKIVHELDESAVNNQTIDLDVLNLKPTVSIIQ